MADVFNGVDDKLFGFNSLREAPFLIIPLFTAPKLAQTDIIIIIIVIVVVVVATTKNPNSCQI